MKPFVFVVLLAAALPAGAQTTANPTLPALDPAITVGMRVGLPLSGYEDGGRRDPFASLIMPKRTASPTSDGRPRTGLAAVALADVTVRGIVRHGERSLAILETAGKQSFVARPKDRLLDASIQAIEADGVVFVESSTGPGTPNRVRKALRSAGEDVR
jgi:hypothetical protein